MEYPVTQRCGDKHFSSARRLGHFSGASEQYAQLLTMQSCCVPEEAAHETHKDTDNFLCHGSMVN
jgi:hypothetical protein